MAETVITKIVDVQTGKAVTNVRQLKKEINSLKDYLASLDKTSAEYTKTIERLNQYEAQLNNVNKISQQNTQKLADQLANLSRIGSGLAGGFGALNGLLALLGKSGDDLSKVLVKLQGGIAVVQGIGGLEGLANSLPTIKGWFDRLKDGVLDLFENLSPFNRRITESAQALNSLDIQPIKDLAGIGDVNISTSVSGGSKEIAQTTQALQQQQKTIVPVNEQWDKYITNQTKVISRQKNLIANTQKSIEVVKQQIQEVSESDRTLSIYYDQVKELQEQYGQSLVDARINAKAALQGMGLDYNKAIQVQQKYANGTTGLKEVLKDLQYQEAGQVKELQQYESALQKAEFAQSKLGKAWSATKSVISTVGWTALITVITAAVFKLFEWIAATYKASKAQQEFNKAINKTTSELAGDSLAAFNELLNVYNQFGDKKEFLKEYSEQIEKTGLKINDVKDAEDAFVNNTEDYKNAIIARAQIDAYRQKISEKTTEYINNQLEIERQGAEDLQKALQNAAQYATGTSVETIRVANKAQVDKALKENEESYTEFVSNITNKTEELRKKYKPFWASKDKEGSGSTTKTEIDKDLEALNSFLKESEKLFYTEKENAINALDEQYQEMLSLAERYGVDSTRIDEIYLVKKNEILNKYLDKNKQDEKENQKSRYDQFKEELARIRQLSDTSNLRQPQEQAYNTRYGQKFSRAFGAGFDRNEVFTYQSKEDVQKQYADTIKYNNDLYALTKQRIDAENKLLTEQLSNSQLTADQRLEIERTLKENEIALSDAAIKNEQDNAKAYDDVQAKKRLALQSTLSVASNVMSSLASIAQTESQNEKLSEEQRKKAFTTYKVAATTQAIMDTYAAANSSYQSMASIPYVGPFLGAAAAAAAIAAGIANVVQIQRTQFSSSSSVSASTVTPPAVTQPNIEYTRNLLGDKEIDEVNKPIKVYVTERDITDAQNRVKVVNDNATF